MVFTVNSSDSPGSSITKRSAAADMSDLSDVFTTGAKSDCDAAQGSDTSSGRFHTHSKAHEKENAPVEAASQKKDLSPANRNYLSDDSSDIEVTAAFVNRSSGKHKIVNRPEVEVTGEVVNKVYLPALPSPCGALKKENEPGTSNTMAKPKYKANVPLGIGGGRKIEKRRRYSESSSDGSEPRGRGNVPKGFGKLKALSSSPSEDFGKSSPGSNIGKPMQAKGQGTAPRRSMVKGAFAKSVNVAYSEGSDDYDSDEWCSYSNRDVERKLLDYRPTSKIPVSKKLDFLEVVERKLSKNTKKGKVSSKKPKLAGRLAACCACDSCTCPCHKPNKEDDSDEDPSASFRPNRRASTAPGRGRSARKLFA